MHGQARMGPSWAWLGLVLAELGFDRVSSPLIVLIFHLLDFFDHYYVSSNVMSYRASKIRDPIILVATGSDHICLGISLNKLFSIKKNVLNCSFIPTR